MGFLSGLAANGQLGGGGGGGLAVDVSQSAPGTNLGATKTINFGGTQKIVLLSGILNANLTVTMTNWVAGDIAYLELLQDGTGNRTLTVTDGVTPKVIAISPTANSLSRVEVQFPDGSTVDPATTGSSTPIGDQLYLPSWPHIVAPPGAAHFTAWSNGGVLANLTPKGWRVVVPHAGVLHHLNWWVVTQSGNLNALIYDTGDASAGNRTLLYSSGSIACGAAGGFQEVDPNLTVSAHQQLDFLLVADNVTASFMRSATGAQTNQWPANFNPVPGGASPKQSFQYPAIGAIGSPSATVAEASVTLTGGPPVLLATVT